MDTHLGNVEIDRIKQRFNVFGFCVPSIGKSGGLALLWQKDINVTIQSYSKNHIDAEVKLAGNEEDWRLTGRRTRP